jgi:hypothetical protein
LAVQNQVNMTKMSCNEVCIININSAAAAAAAAVEN